MLILYMTSSARIRKKKSRPCTHRSKRYAISRCHFESRTNVGENRSESRFTDLWMEILNWNACVALHHTCTACAVLFRETMDVFMTRMIRYIYKKEITFGMYSWNRDNPYLVFPDLGMGNDGYGLPQISHGHMLCLHKSLSSIASTTMSINVTSLSLYSIFLK
jgi:hypothetical protein